MPGFKIVPLGKSRYFQFEVATCDDYIFCHKEIDDAMSEISSLSNVAAMPILFKRALSYGGQIIFHKQEGFLNAWIEKVYGSGANSLTSKLIKFDGFVYNVAATDLFKSLESRCKPDFKDFITSGDKLIRIDINNRVIHTEKHDLEYDNIINTIPLDAFLRFCGIEPELDKKDLHTFVVETNELDFEGASELLVVDQNIDFFKCTRIAKKAYQFYSTSEIMNLPQYLNLLMNNYDILSATVVRDAIPLGEYEYNKLEDNGIYCVGSNAQWDDMMDLSSCILKIVRISNRFSKN